MQQLSFESVPDISLPPCMYIFIYFSSLLGHRDRRTSESNWPWNNEKRKNTTIFAVVNFSAPC
jgi:hypothetical protein